MQLQMLAALQLPFYFWYAKGVCVYKQKSEKTTLALTLLAHGHC